MSHRFAAWALTAAGILMATSAAADCNRFSPDRRMQAQDRCPATSVAVPMQEGGGQTWRTLGAGDEQCFEVQRNSWSWRCRGELFTARCRGLRPDRGAYVTAKFYDNVVIWQCQPN